MNRGRLASRLAGRGWHEHGACGARPPWTPSASLKLTGPTHAAGQRYEPRRAIKRAKAAVHEILATYATAADAEDYGGAEVFREIEDVPEELRDETKHEGFRHEEESRIAVNADQQLARHRSEKLGMIPYIAITGTDESADLVVHTTNRLPIRELYISPGRDRQRTAWTLMVLMLNGCSHDFTTDGATGILQAVTGWIGHSGL